MTCLGKNPYLTEPSPTSSAPQPPQPPQPPSTPSAPQPPQPPEPEPPEPPQPNPLNPTQPNPQPNPQPSPQPDPNPTRFTCQVSLRTTSSPAASSSPLRCSATAGRSAPRSGPCCSGRIRAKTRSLAGPLSFWCQSANPMIVFGLAAILIDLSHNQNRWRVASNPLPEDFTFWEDQHLAAYLAHPLRK